jgi:hypothetical protein
VIPSREPGRPFECIVTAAGELRPVHPDRARALSTQEGQRVTVRLLDADDIRRDRANRYWWVAIVGTVKGLWEHELDALIPKEAVHDKLVTIFGGGLVDTPEGPARTSSRTKTVREFAAMTNEVRDYVWHRWGVPIPSGEDWLRDHSDEEAA